MMGMAKWSRWESNPRPLECHAFRGRRDHARPAATVREIEHSRPSRRPVPSERGYVGYGLFRHLARKGRSWRLCPVRSEPFDELAVPSRGQPDHLERPPLALLSLGEEEGQAIGGLARSARNENDTGAEQRVVEEPVVQREGGDEERAQQRLLGFGRLGVGGSRGGSGVAGVERGGFSAVADAVGESG